jgi:hypothetical protein
VLSNPLRHAATLIGYAATLIGAMSLLVLAGPVAAAGAEVTASKITSPTGSTYALDQSLTPAQKAFTVEGTTEGSGDVTLRCYYGAGAAEEYSTVVEKVIVSGLSGGPFAVEVEESSLPALPCVLRAVPIGEVTARPPGDATKEAEDPFRGPRIASSRFGTYLESLENPASAYEYEAEPSTFVGDFGIDSVGDCGLKYSVLYAPETLAPSDGLFFCNGALHEYDSATKSRSELQIDGANAYSPAAAHLLEKNELELKTSLPGAPYVTVSETFEAGLLTLHELDPIVKCAPSTAYPPTATSCTHFVSAGVQLERTWQTSYGDRVASMIDTWRSTNGAAHTLNALYDQQTFNGGKGGGAYEFPGTNQFLPTSGGESVTLPAGLGRIYYKEDAATANEGDGVHPQGAIVYDTPPSGPIAVYRGTAAEEDNGFEMPYLGTIPAGGAYTLRMGFVQAYKLSEVEALAASVLAGYPASSPPTVSISAPVNGTTVATPNVAVAGTVSDTRAITSFTVDGKAVAVGSGGAWATSVPLIQGVNTIKALATDQAGFSTEKSVNVTYRPTPPAPQASEVGSATGANGKVTFTILCTGTAGTSCQIEATLTTLEKSRNGHPVAVAARHHRRTRSSHPKTRSKELTVGSFKLTIPAGQRVTIAIPLNSTGTSLLTRFGKLPVHLSVVLVSAGHSSSPIIAQNLTVKPRHHRQKQHHHHRRHHHRR